MPGSPDALRGTLDLLVLKALARDSQHGWGIGQYVQACSSGLIEVNQGSLYPALQRLEYAGHITGSWGVSDHGRRARFYRITAAGKKALVTETEAWNRFARGVGLVLAT